MTRKWYATLRHPKMYLVAVVNAPGWGWRSKFRTSLDYFGYLFSFIGRPQGKNAYLKIIFSFLNQNVLMTPSSVRRPSTFLNVISSETTGPIELNFHIKTLLDVGTKVCSNGPGHMTKMAVMPIYGKKPFKIFSRTRKLMTLGMWGLPSLFK